MNVHERSRSSKRSSRIRDPVRGVRDLIQDVRDLKPDIQPVEVQI